MNLLFRADASVAIGTGHVMRCLALAQACRNAGGRAVFVMAPTTEGVRERLAKESCPAFFIGGDAGSDTDAQQTIALAHENKAECVVVDGYQFGADYQAALKAAGLKVLFLDDYGHAAHYAADLVLNQNSYASENMYSSRESYTRLLLGSQYCLLRREFSSWRGHKREIAVSGRKILVTLGGSDPGNLTEVVIDALRELTGIEVIVVVGGSNPHFDQLQQAALQFGDWLQLKRGVTNMPELMAWADVAIAGAGTTCWEMCLLKLPMALIDLAQNQKPIARSLETSGAAIHLGTAGAVAKDQIVTSMRDILASQAERHALSVSCGKLVDGQGTTRVLSELTRV